MPAKIRLREAKETLEEKMAARDPGDQKSAKEASRISRSHFDLEEVECY